MTETFQTRSEAIECEACASAIQRSLGKMAGVQKVAVDVLGKAVRVEYHPAQVSESDLRERLIQAGFPAA